MKNLMTVITVIYGFLMKVTVRLMPLDQIVEKRYLKEKFNASRITTMIRLVIFLDMF